MMTAAWRGMSRPNILAERNNRTTEKIAQRKAYSKTYSAYSQHASRTRSTLIKGKRKAPPMTTYRSRSQNPGRRPETHKGGTCAAR